MLLALVLAAAAAAAPVDADLERRRVAGWTELAEWVVDKGQDRKLGPATAAALDLPAQPIPVKKVWFDPDEKDPASWGRALSAALDREGRAAWLLVQVERSSAAAKGGLEGYAFVVDLGGRMRAAAKLPGGAVEVSDPEVVERFRAEARFWRREAMGLPLRLD